MHFALATVFTLIAIFFRFPGIPIFFTGLIWLLIRKEFKLAIIYFSAIAIPIAIWFVPTLAFEYSYFEQLSPHQESSGIISYIVIILRRFVMNMGRYFLSYIPQLLMMDSGTRLPRRVSVIPHLSFAQLITGVLFTFILVFTLIRRIIKKQLIFPILFVAVYFIAVSPAVSNMLRYSTYLYFWIILTILVGFNDIFSWKKISNFLKIIVILLFFGLQFYFIRM